MIFHIFKYEKLLCFLKICLLTVVHLYGLVGITDFYHSFYSYFFHLSPVARPTLPVPEWSHRVRFESVRCENKRVLLSVQLCRSLLFKFLVTWFDMFVRLPGVFNSQHIKGGWSLHWGSLGPIRVWSDHVRPLLQHRADWAQPDCQTLPIFNLLSVNRLDILLMRSAYLRYLEPVLTRLVGHSLQTFWST